MHLKHMEIVGFKSFSDRSKLDFGTGITAIVGPNGCGKSNIIDAFRWCLGEMSVKSLRSNMMMDVVFNGSGARPPQNMAEVTLTFDNTDKRLPIDYSDVAITRRLFRSGESEYFINKTQCRLRDIRELFLDTGMGEDGYSSIEQGKVEWILNAKPEDRRELFEEAAGVSKYRARREEAVRKLDRVEIDLSRLTDIISVTRDQIRKLESAVTRAKTYQRIREELKGMEIGDWLAQMNSFELQLAETSNRLTDLQAQSEQLNTQVHQKDTILTELRTTLTSTEEQMLQANSVLSAIDADIKIGQERLNNAGQREQDLVQQLANFAETMKRETLRIEELNVQLAQQQLQLDQVKEKGDAIESDFQSAQSSYDNSLKNLEDKKSSAKELRDRILDRAQERSRIQQQIAYLTSDATKLETQALNLQKEKERITVERATLAKTKEQSETQVSEFLTQVEEKSSYLQEKTRRLSELTLQQDNLRLKILEISEEIARLRGQIHSIEAQQSQDPYLAGAQAILSNGLPNIEGPLGAMIRTSRPSDQDMVAATIGEHLGDLVAHTAEDAQRAIQFLSVNDKGRARIWILEKLAPPVGALGNLPSGDLLLNRITCADSIKPLIAHLCESIVVDGVNAYGTAVINGGMDPSKWKSHVNLRLPELNELLADKEKAKGSLEDEAQNLIGQQSALSAERDAALKEMEEVRIRLELAQAEQTRFKQQLTMLNEEEATSDRELSVVLAEQAKALQSLNEGRLRFDELQNLEQNDHAQLDVLHQELTELQLVHANANADLSGKKEKHNQFQDQLKWHRGIIEHTSKELTNVGHSIERHQKSISLTEAEIQTARGAQEEAKALIAESLQKRQAAAEACAGVQKQRVKLSEEIQSIDTELHQVRRTATALQETVQDERIKQVSMQDRMESLRQKIQDQYEMTFEAARESFPPVAADPEALDKLKKRVANIGPINLAAPQEHAELAEKEQFLSTQQADLLKAKDDLRQVITKINATTREHFKNTYEAVRENFRRLYSQLFQGGEADLQLTNPEDILSSGVDIFCQPPGKKVMHISLMSGGEKALTACALLFAFFQVRPSPVALLDEVDAPLDEANVLRYVELVKLMSEKSQFLLISHNKRTMEVADNLYGVTMEEFGVSKILSARLQKERKKIEASIEPEAATV